MIVKVFIKKVIVAALLVAGLPLLSIAQNEPTIEDLQRQMLAMQRRMMQQFEKGFHGNGWAMPGDSSSYFFHLDTTFGGSSIDFFRFSPFGSERDSAFARPDEFFRRFFDFGENLEQWGETDPRSPEGTEYLDDEGSEEELLPEEKLRQKEQNMAGEPKPETPKSDIPKKPKRKVTRI